MQVQIDNSWKELLAEEFDKEYFKILAEFVKTEYKQAKVYPPGPLIFNAFNLCPVDKVKVVIIGQDPYHGEGQANGLSFSVNNGISLPPSLRNIFKELKSDWGVDKMQDGDLSKWAEQGILMLNATLTVRHKQPTSHNNKGWEKFTDRVIELLSEQKENLVFVLWGAYAQAKQKLIDTTKHLIIASPHPSPFSADKGFFGSKPFSKVNHYLKETGQTIIDW